MPQSLSEPAPQAAYASASAEPAPLTREPTLLGFPPKPALGLLIFGALVLIVLGYIAWSLGGVGAENRFSAPMVYRVAVVVVLMLFIPFTAASYYVVRREVRRRQLRENCRALGLDYQYYFHRVYKRDMRESHFLYAVCFTSVVTLLGLTAVMLGHELGLSRERNLLLLGAFNSANSHEIENYQTGTLLFFGMAFLGAYLWGLQHILHRYYTSDLSPAVYYGLGTRMIFAAIIALMVYHMLPDIAEPGIVATGADGTSSTAGTIGSSFLPALAFLIGIFPQRALQYMTERLNGILSPTTPAAREVPLDLIQGMSVNDRLRLAEEGIESCVELANAEFVQLLFTTPYQPLELIDWQLQARLVLYFGKATEQLREQGIRDISDLKKLTEEEAIQLAEKSTATKAAVAMARRRAGEDPSLKFLENLRDTLLGGGMIKKCADPSGPPPPGGPSAEPEPDEPGPDGPLPTGDGNGQVLIERGMQSGPPPAGSPNGGA